MEAVHWETTIDGRDRVIACGESDGLRTPKASVATCVKCLRAAVIFAAVEAALSGGGPPKWD